MTDDVNANLLIYRKKIHLRSNSLRSNERKIFYFPNIANKYNAKDRWVNVHHTKQLRHHKVLPV